MLLFVALGTAGPDETEWTDASAKIPIEYLPTRKGEIRQLLLFVSSDRGGTWTQHSTAQPGQSHFQFTADKSGPQWFVLVIESQNGDRQPTDVTKAEPGLKMYFRIPTSIDRIPKAKD
jgi:hypothetical protein